MSVRISGAAPAMSALADLAANQRDIASAAKHLASGLRVVGSSDDAAGLAIGTSLTTQINGLTQALANTRDASAVAEIADGALASVGDTLQRMRALVLRAGNVGVYGPNALAALSREVGALTELLDAIAEFTASGHHRLLDGGYSAAFQVGANGGENVILDLSGADMHAANVGGSGAGTGTDLTRMAILGPDAAAGIYTVSGVRADLEALTKSITAVSDRRAMIGAVVGRLDATSANLMAALTSVISSRSTLMDADMADEAGRFVSSSIRSRAAAFVVAQANSSPRAVLRLLDGSRMASDDGSDSGPRHASNRRSTGSATASQQDAGISDAAAGRPVVVRAAAPAATSGSSDGAQAAAGADAGVTAMPTRAPNSDRASDHSPTLPGEPTL